MTTTDPKPSMLLVLAALTALAMLATNVVLPLMPEIIASVRGDASDTSKVLWVFLGFFASGQLIAGPLSDRFGRRPVLFGGLMLFIAGSITASSAGSLSGLLIGRALQGLGASAASVLSRAILRDLFTGPALARALGLVMAVMAMAPGFSPLLGALIGETLGWRAAFGTLALAAGLFGIAHHMLIGESLPRSNRTYRGLGSLVRGYWSLACNAQFLQPAIGNALGMAALFAYFAATPAVLRRDFGFGALGVGMFFATTVFSVFFASGQAARWINRFGPTRVTLAGVTAMLFGGAAAPLAGTVGWLGFAVVVFLFGVGLVIPTTTARALHPFAAHAGQASALLGFLQMSIAALVLVLLSKLPLPPSVAFGVLASGASLLALGNQWIAHRAAAAIGAQG